MSSERELVLVADDETISREFLSEALSLLGFDVHSVCDGAEALAALDSDLSFDYVVTDLQMPGATGQEVIAKSKSLDPDRPVLLVTAHGTLHVAVSAMRGGADDILEKPVTTDELELALLRAREKRLLRRENRFFRSQSIGHEMVIASDQMRQVEAVVERVAASAATVLISGESGTGKERVAALVHKQSPRRNRPFVKINCAAIPESLMESELFGHEAGAFTGATARREGCFELADGGTLFLDEIGEMSPSLQPKLLRVLQEGEFCRVGGSKTVSVDVRVVVATNRDLADEVARGSFREDLYYRLNVVPIVVPPLRDRPQEVLALARHFLSGDVEIDPAAEEILLRYPWPGNVRELQNLIQRASILCGDSRIDRELLSEWLEPDSEPNVMIPVGPAVSASKKPKSLREIEGGAIAQAMDYCEGNRTRAAQVLGIGVRTLFNKLKHLPEPTPARSSTAND